MGTSAEIAAQPGAAPRAPAVDARGLSKHFGGVRALREVSFCIAPGEILGILGPNGAGKSTLINVISGLSPATAGTVSVCGKAMEGLDMAGRAREGLFRTFQNTRPSEELTGPELLRLATLTPNRTPGGVAFTAAELLDAFGLAGYADQLLAELPYGVQKMFVLAAVAICRPRVMFLDEPFQGVADAEITRLAGVIRHIAAAGVAIGLVEHNVRSVMDLCARVMVLDSGALIFDGQSAEAMRDPGVQEAYLGRGPAGAAHG